MYELIYIPLWIDIGAFIIGKYNPFIIINGLVTQ